MGNNNKILITILIVVILGAAVFLILTKQKNAENLQIEPQSLGNNQSELEKPREIAYTEADKLEFENFINENINALSPEPAVLGGSFYVTNIDWTYPNIALINYEDGHVAYHAEIQLSFNENGQVILDSFTLVIPPDDPTPEQIEEAQERERLLIEEGLLLENEAQLEATTTIE